MRISYNWLQKYLPEVIEPQKLSAILTSIGLEVENLQKTGIDAGKLKGLVVGEIMSAEKHKGADKLKLTRVDTGNGELLQIVCGASNVEVGQKVVVAPVGTTIYPVNNDPVLIKAAKIRGENSYGMICAEDEIGISEDHTGIMVLPSIVKKGSLLADHLDVNEDWIYEIGLTPNRIDAMSHLGVARDVCAFLSNIQNKNVEVVSPYNNDLIIDNHDFTLQVVIENTHACQRYSGITISNIKVESSPSWLQASLKSIGLRPVNNIVDITNFILHETGQPLHAFDADKIKGKNVIVKNLPSGTIFTTLDGKQRTLHQEDLMICDRNSEPMCFGGVYGGIDSGVTNNTTVVFLESAWFEPLTIRKTSIRHNLRTDAAARFEKGTDISNTVNVLKRAAGMIKEIASGQISSEVIDAYPAPKSKNSITLKYDYLKKISGKVYSQSVIENILYALGFDINSKNDGSITVAVPYSKPDVLLPADVIEEIMRIDGFDNIEIPSGIFISSATDDLADERAYQENISAYLVGNGFHEIFTNSITNSAYYNESQLASSVRILNSLSVELDIMRPSLLQTGLEVISYNVNRKSNNLLLFEFGMSYAKGTNYKQNEHLCLYLSGNKNDSGWKIKENAIDIYYLKGICERIFNLVGVAPVFEESKNLYGSSSLNILVEDEELGSVIEVKKEQLDKFGLKQRVLFADILWEKLLAAGKKKKIEYKEIAKYPLVHRDLSIIVDKDVSFSKLEKVINNVNIKKLIDTRLFDVFESEKLGKNKKSFAISLTFSDPEKTMTDQETDAMIKQVIDALEKDLNAQIRTSG